MTVQTTDSCSAAPTANASLARVRRVFERRAAQAERADFLWREIAARMHERLDYIRLAPQRLLDAGCGRGADLEALQKRYPEVRAVGVDLAQGMARRAAADAGMTRLPAWLRRFVPSPRQLVQADFGCLPFADESFDMLWSNLALHWHPQPDAVFPEWRRVLQAGGLLMFSVFGPDTLRELRDAWREAELACGLAPAAHVLPFVDMHDFGDMLVSNGFETPVMDMETIGVTYRDADALLADVRRLGAQVPMARADLPAGTASAGLGGRARLDALRRALDARRVDGVITLTFEIAYGHAWRRASKPDGTAVVRVDQIGGRRRRPE